MPNQTTLTDIACAGCACLCDDVRLEIESGQVASVASDCQQGEQWFTQPTVPRGAACYVDGQPVSLGDAVAAAAQLLTDGNRVLIDGMAGATIESQRHAVAIADLCGGVVAASSPAGAEAVATHGSVSATLGDVAQRADVVLFWRCDPATTHPRHFERYSLHPTSQWLPGGRGDRHVIAIGDADTPTAAEADRIVPFRRGRDYEALGILRALGRSQAHDEEKVLKSTGGTLVDWQSLAETVAAGKYVAVFYDGSLVSEGAATLGALTQWMVDLQNRGVRAVALPLGGGQHHANAAGAASVAAWQTGYAGVVDFATGYPKQLDTLPSNIDAELIVSAESLTTTRPHTKRVVLAATGEPIAADVLFRVAPPGFAAKASMQRSDGVTLPLRGAWATDALPAEEVLAAIEAAVASATATSAAGSHAGDAAE